ncbi:hypothetical protein BCR33DRAFT_711917 [Rhizoclosmatium globosum]|uniref:DUF1212-domain-containing protein n=1 Tax=Rhizoclosmatium globosum TaxID=329046 RepID=A0A1Y2D069_9FUNG|nr:hypothetical protein BCR33DRAFT_711917 [Rhizoclosmatium globosum]|eukprot:ORY52668.1 hypothetical protein BCR33DRAFT_711917 [Rhizoclosmatium globosum]
MSGDTTHPIDKASRSLSSEHVLDISHAPDHRSPLHHVVDTEHLDEPGPIPSERTRSRSTSRPTSAQRGRVNAPSNMISENSDLPTHHQLNITREASIPITRPSSARTRPFSGGRPRLLIPNRPNSIISETEKVNDPDSTSNIIENEHLINLLDEFLYASTIDDEGHPVCTPSRMKLEFDTKTVEIQPDTLKNIERFVMLLVKSLQGFGVPTHLLEFHASEVAKGLGHPAAFAIFPSFIIATFAHNFQSHGDANYEILRNPALAQTIFIHTSPGLNMYKLQLVKELCTRVSSYKKDGPAAESNKAASNASLKQPRFSLTKKLSFAIPEQNLLNNLQKGSKSSLNTSFRKLAQTRVSEDDEEHLICDSVLHKEPSVSSTDAERNNQIAQLKQIILGVASRGDNVYQALDQVVETAKTENLPEDVIARQAQRIKNAFAVIAVEDATSKLEEILALPPLYPRWVQVLASGTNSGCLSGLFFGGGVADIIVSVVLGSGVSAVGKIIRPPFDKTFEFFAAAVVAMTVRFLMYLGIPLCYASVTITSIITLVQGISITMAMVELATRNMVSGTTRLFSGLTMTCLIGFGLEFGLQVISGIMQIPKNAGDISDPNADNIYFPNNCVAVNPQWKWLLFPLAVLAQAVNMNAHYQQMPGMFVSAGIVFLVRLYLTKWFNFQIAVAASAFACGCFSNVYARIRGLPAMVPTYAGMMLLVPGSMAVRSVTELIGSDPTQGVSMVMTIVSVSLAIALGLFLAVTVIVPIQDWSDYLRGKHRKVDDLENLRF